MNGITKKPPSSESEQYWSLLETVLGDMQKTLLMMPSSNGSKVTVSTKQLTSLLSTLSAELSEDQALLGLSSGEIAISDPNEWTLWRIKQAQRSIEIVSWTLNDLSNRLNKLTGLSSA